jgi:tRNA (guanine-N7-)-methyltransferase
MVYLARSNPDHNFLGIEWASKFYRFAADRIRRWNLVNARMLRTDARELVLRKIPPASVTAFHIYFPDPWPKKKHHKRRFINDINLVELLRCLKTGGMIKVATDHAGYFEQIQEVLSHPALARVDFFRTAGAQAESGEWAGTNFERKYLKEGRPIYTLAAAKK